MFVHGLPMVFTSAQASLFFMVKSSIEKDKNQYKLPADIKKHK